MTFDKRPTYRHYDVLSFKPPRWDTVVSFVDYFSAMRTVASEWEMHRRARILDLKGKPQYDESKENVVYLTPR